MRVRVGACTLAICLAAACGDDGDDGKAPVDGSAGDGEPGDGADGSPSDGEPGDGADGSPSDGEQSDGEPGDGEPGDVSEAVTACVAEAIPGDTDMERFTFTGDGISVGFVRHIRPDWAGTSGTRIWDLDRMAVSDARGDVCVSELAALEYVGSYHNFDDRMVASVGDTRFELSQRQEGYDFPIGYALTRKQGDTVDYGPLTLTLAGCTLLNDDSDCVERYDR